LQEILKQVLQREGNNMEINFKGKKSTKGRTSEIKDGKENKNIFSYF
jgi:hypothetical protein